MEWISVKENLPRTGEYLVAYYEWTGLYKDKPKTIDIGVKGFNEGWGWHKKAYSHDTGGYEWLEVTHWMPLPEAPKD